MRYYRLSKKYQSALDYTYYSGPFNRRVVSNMARETAKAQHLSPQQAWKVYSILIEMGQNIRLYSEEVNFNKGVEEKVGNIGVSIHSQYIEIESVNIGTKKEANKLIQRCQLIREKSFEELRRFKIDEREKAISKQCLGGNIGLIQVALLSKNPIAYELLKLNDLQYLVYLRVKINT